MTIEIQSHFEFSIYIYRLLRHSLVTIVSHTTDPCISTSDNDNRPAPIDGQSFPDLHCAFEWRVGLSFDAATSIPLESHPLFNATIKWGFCGELMVVTAKDIS